MKRSKPVELTDAEVLKGQAAADEPAKASKSKKASKAAKPAKAAAKAENAAAATAPAVVEADTDADVDLPDIENMRHVNRTPEDKKALIIRLNRIEGQVRGIKKMIENDVYCPDILVQTAATTAALNGFSKELLNAHIRNCVTADLKAGKEETVDELLHVLQKLMR